jgi:hypothetical protein
MSWTGGPARVKAQPWSTEVDGGRLVSYRGSLSGIAVVDRTIGVRRLRWAALCRGQQLAGNIVVASVASCVIKCPHLADPRPKVSVGGVSDAGHCYPIYRT